MTRKQPKHWATVVLLVLVWACRPDAGWQAVSMVDLIADAENYRGRDLFVSGYSRVSRGKLFLFLSEQNARMDDIPSAVLLGQTLGGERMDSIPECQDRFVTVFGRFEKLPTGLNGITAIERVIAYGPSGEIEGDCFSTNRTGP
jgi:hypothetical protein